jgi:hypothetical protein
VDDSGARVDAPHGLDARDRGPHELPLQLVAAAAGGRAELAASPPAQAQKEISLTGQ